MPNNITQFIINDAQSLKIFQNNYQGDSGLIGTLLFSDRYEKKREILTAYPWSSRQTNRMPFPGDPYAQLSSDSYGNIYVGGSSSTGTAGGTFIYIIYRAPPTTPSPVEIIKQGAYYLHLRWTPSSHSAMITHYDLKVILIMGGPPMSRRVNCTSNEYLIEGLSPLTSYEISVAAVNQFGASAYSISRLNTGITDDLPVISVFNNLASPTSFNVSWEVPQSSYVITGFEVEVHDGRSVTPFDLSLPSPTLRSIILDDLYPMTIYSVRIRSLYLSSSPPSSPWSDVVYCTTSSTLNPLVGAEYQRAGSMPLPGSPIQYDVKDMRVDPLMPHEVVYSRKDNTTWVLMSQNIIKVSGGLFCHVAGDVSLPLYDPRFLSLDVPVPASEVNLGVSGSMVYSPEENAIYIADKSNKACIQKIDIFGYGCTSHNNSVTTFVGVCINGGSRRRRRRSGDDEILEFDVDEDVHDDFVDDGKALYHHNKRIELEEETTLPRYSIRLDRPRSLALSKNSSRLFFIDDRDDEETGDKKSYLYKVDLPSGNVSRIYDFGVVVLEASRLIFSSSFGEDEDGLLIWNLYFQNNEYITGRFLSSLLLFQNNNNEGDDEANSVSPPSFLLNNVKERRRGDMYAGDLRDLTISYGVMAHELHYFDFTVHPTRRVLYVLQHLPYEDEEANNLISILIIDFDYQRFGLVGAYPFDQAGRIDDLSSQYGSNFNLFSIMARSLTLDPLDATYSPYSLSMGSNGGDDGDDGGRGSNQRRHYLYYTDYKSKMLQWDADEDDDHSGGRMVDRALETTMVSWNYTHISLMWNRPSYHYLLRNYSVSIRDDIHNNSVYASFSALDEYQQQPLIIEVPSNATLGMVSWNVSVLGFSSFNSIAPAIRASPRIVRMLRPELRRLDGTQLIVPQDGGALHFLGYYLTHISLGEPSFSSPLTGGWDIFSCKLGKLSCEGEPITQEKVLIICIMPAANISHILSASSNDTNDLYVALYHESGDKLVSNPIYWFYNNETSPPDPPLPPTNGTATNSTNENNNGTTPTMPPVNSTMIDIVPFNYTILSPSSPSQIVLNNIEGIPLVQVNIPSLGNLLTGNVSTSPVLFIAHPGDPSLRANNITSSLIDIILQETTKDSTNSTNTIISTNHFATPVNITFLPSSFTYVPLLCLAYYNITMAQWMCEDEHPIYHYITEGGDGSMTGTTYHFTTFALLVNPAARTRDEDNLAPTSSSSSPSSSLSTAGGTGLSPGMVAVAVVVSLVVGVGVAIIAVWQIKRRRGKNPLAKRIIRMETLSTSPSSSNS
eukprot:TRINITY_DN5492_c0_g1_i2.p1 TRINITY_DN5492_c0_g1~~TRINITY_DN5492_c0_g1_i2.p1  ORF type:complete len:1289 (+),score=237.36 TRINITY_DN5492_c0_g1_i2:1343-5209(+)